MLDTGAYATLEDLARAKGVAPSYLSRVLRLTLLAPDIVEAILDGRQPAAGRKRHLVTDTLGLVLRIEVHSAGIQDRDGAALVLDRITRRFPFLERIFADAGYQGPRVAAAAPRPVEIIKRTDTGFVVQPKRWVIERTFAWACINRRLARDVERAAETVRALFQIAMIKLMTRRIARYRDF